MCLLRFACGSQIRGVGVFPSDSFMPFIWWPLAGGFVSLDFAFANPHFPIDLKTCVRVNLLSDDYQTYLIYDVRVLFTNVEDLP